MASTYAYARQARWVGLECESCGARYRCQVEATGQASDSILPLSENDLKEWALSNLDTELQKQAEAIPCPGCGTFPSGYVERVRRITGRLSVWVISLLLIVAMTVLIAFILPRTPLFAIIFVIIAAIVGARLLSAPIVDRFDPNRNLEVNRQFVQAKVTRGVVRTEPPPQ